ncbi:hypothetical protein [Caproiciproducens sp. CPB-2]|nr:hypothetical protein [Caproiciproducens sp. CPB-2]MDF1495444.1 hypothetical protein [Caproiciproducens sp. CPB-2]
MNEKNVNRKLSPAQENNYGNPVSRQDEYEIPDEVSCSMEFSNGCIGE